jgi:hypothetical protein
LSHLVGHEARSMARAFWLPKSAEACSLLWLVAKRFQRMQQLEHTEQSPDMSAHRVCITEALLWASQGWPLCLNQCQVYGTYVAADTQVQVAHKGA